jgi:GNAT superfamily N-acetyltransferase
MIFESLLHTDLDSVKELQPEGWYDIVPYNKYFIDSEFCEPIKAVIDNKLVGIGTAIMHKDTVWLAHIIVHPNHRSKGIGRAITEKLIENYKGSAFKTIYLIATDLGAPLYTKLGFITETEYAFYKEGNFDKNTSLSPNIVPFQEKFRDEILAMDREISGEDRENRLKESIESSLVYKESDNILGCYFHELGEGMIIARSSQAGIELMKLRLKVNDNAVLPVDNTAAIQFLLNNGFKEVRKAKRMYLGEKRTWNPQGLFNRVGGQIG